MNRISDGARSECRYIWSIPVTPSTAMLECKYAGIMVIFIFCSSEIITHTSFGQISKDEIVNSEVLISRIGRNVDTSIGHYICQFYHMITLILLVIIFILRKIKIITNQKLVIRSRK